VPASVRYTPSWAPGEGCQIGYDFSFIIPVGVGLESGTLSIQTNTANPAPALADFNLAAPLPCNVRDRALYCFLAGGVSGTDYQLVWTAVDTAGNTWPRTALMLCAPTS
jgi:hypothetical protein